jgi:hypothetical protein
MAASRDERTTLADLPVERNQQGKIICRGPRVGVLVHSSHDIAVNILGTPPRNKKRSISSDIAGPGRSEKVDHLRRQSRESSSASRVGRISFPSLHRGLQNILSINDIEGGVYDIEGSV